MPLDPIETQLDGKDKKFKQHSNASIKRTFPTQVLCQRKNNNSILPNSAGKVITLARVLNFVLQVNNCFRTNQCIANNKQTNKQTKKVKPQDIPRLSSQSEHDIYSCIMIRSLINSFVPTYGHKSI